MSAKTTKTAKKGMQEVEAVARDEIRTVERKLEQHFGGRLFADVWVFGVNTALRISDLLSIKMADVARREVLALVESKTGKSRTIELNERALEVVNRRLAEHPEHIYLFQSESNRARSLAKPVTRQSVARAFQEVGKILGIHLGTHSMRKSLGRAMFDENRPLELISKTLNHASTGVTMRYIGIEKRDIQQVYRDFVL